MDCGAAISPMFGAPGRTASNPDVRHGQTRTHLTSQTSAPINPGNSGGALVDLEDKVVGIPTLAATDPQLGGAVSGIGFGIPSNVAVDIANQLISHGRVVDSHRAYLGVQAVDVTGAPGALVYSARSGGSAAAAGITPGDLITAINGTATPDSAALTEVLANLAPGQSVRIAIVRPDGTRATVTATLGELPG